MLADEENSRLHLRSSRRRAERRLLPQDGHRRNERARRWRKRGASEQAGAPCSAYDLGELHCRCVPTLVHNQMLSTVNRVARWTRRSPFARSLRAKPCRERYDDSRQRKNQRESKSEAVGLPCHLSPHGNDRIAMPDFRWAEQE